MSAGVTFQDRAQAAQELLDQGLVFCRKFLRFPGTGTAEYSRCRVYAVKVEGVDGIVDAEDVGGEFAGVGAGVL